MPSALESQAALRLLTYNADQRTRAFISTLSGSATEILAQLFEAIPELIAYYQDGASALAADLFDDLREEASTRRRFRADPVIENRADKIRNAVAWAADTQRAEGDVRTTEQRLAEVVQREIARPYRDTITVNSQRDPESVGWARVAGDSCGFCRMLASRGAVYMRDTARFAAHGSCDCTAQPVFKNGRVGPEADAFQYLASKQSKTPRDKARLRAYLAANFPD